MEEERNENLPATSEHEAQEDRTWRDVAEAWKGVGKQVKNLGDRLATAFREGWEAEEMTAKDTQQLADRLKTLAERMDRAVDAVRDESKDPVTRARAKQTARATREASTELLQELQETLNEGLEDVNRRVDDILEKRRQKKQGGDAG